MPTVKASYEAVFIFSLSAGEESTTALLEKFQTLIAQSAELGVVDDWGKRRLAYPIQDENDGHYVLFNFVSEPAFPAELERVAGITDGVLRVLVVRKPPASATATPVAAPEAAAAPEADAPTDTPE